MPRGSSRRRRSLRTTASTSDHRIEPVGLAGAGWAEEDDVGRFEDEAELGQVGHNLLAHGALEGEIKVIEGFIAGSRSSQGAHMRASALVHLSRHQFTRPGPAARTEPVAWWVNGRARRRGAVPTPSSSSAAPAAGLPRRRSPSATHLCPRTGASPASAVDTGQTIGTRRSRLRESNPRPTHYERLLQHRLRPLPATLATATASVASP